MNRLVIVSASTNPNRAVPCLASWGPTPKILVLNGPEAEKSSSWQGHVGNVTTLSQKEYLGTVPAFAAGVDYALEHTDAEIIACLHDDVEMQDADWAKKVIDRFDRQPAVGLLGFGGAIGLGDDDIYQTPYKPVQLARKGFRSNLVDAEVHGVRSLLPERVACLDGFSMIGRRQFWEGRTPSGEVIERPFHLFSRLGVHHHAYDSWTGVVASRHGWECWYLPIRARHMGGQTAVGDAGYQAWAKTQNDAGDQGFWEQAHKAFYDNCRDILPLRV